MAYTLRVRADRGSLRRVDAAAARRARKAAASPAMEPVMGTVARSVSAGVAITGASTARTAPAASSRLRAG